MSILNVSGLVLSVVTGATAAVLARRGSTNYHAASVYGLTSAAHTRYALAGLTLAAGFGVAFFVAAIPSAALLTLAVLLAIFYFTSFLRGFAEDE